MVGDDRGELPAEKIEVLFQVNLDGRTLVFDFFGLLSR